MGQSFTAFLPCVLSVGFEMGLFTCEEKQLTASVQYKVSSYEKKDTLEPTESSGFRRSNLCRLKTKSVFCKAPSIEVI